jgi:plastocyanin
MPDLPPDPHARTHPGRVGRVGRVALLGAALVLAAVAAGCTSSDGPAGSSSSTVAPAPRTVTVHIVDGDFDPRRVEVAVGGSVTWVNDDQTEHLIAFAAPNVIGSPLIGKAGSYTRSFDAPGQYRYYCTIHNEMKGEVVVR